MNTVMSLEERKAIFSQLNGAASLGDIKTIQAIIEMPYIAQALSYGATSFFDVAFSEAAQHGQVEVLELFIHSGVPVNSSVSGDFTPLYQAVVNDNLEMVKLLLEHGANPNDAYGIGMYMRYLNYPTYYGLTPLHIAAQNGNVAILDALLAKGGIVNVLALVSAYTPLFYAVENGNLEAVKLLIENGANVNAPEGYYTPLEMAIFSGNVDIIQLLEEHGAVRDDVQITPDEALIGILFEDEQTNEVDLNLYQDSDAEAPLDLDNDAVDVTYYGMTSYYV